MRIFDTLSGRKEDVPSGQKSIAMYVCGITPYDVAHLGRGMSYVIFDVIRRYLEHKGYQVKHVQNFTDIDDKLIDKGAKTGQDPLSVAEHFISRFHEDMDRLHVLRAHVYPRATQEVPEIIRIVQGLIQKGHAYASPNGDVYYRVQSFPEYGQLSKRTLDGMRAGARIAVTEEKDNPLDFVLWKSAKPGEPQWDSPWGPGRPGWHIECSAMSLKYLGQRLDIHGGGQDLIFPHHENEIAQTEAFTGARPFARWWVHNGLLRLGEEKMSKSLGNLVRLREALDKYGADTIRLFVLNSHYRNPLTYGDDVILSARQAALRLRRAAAATATGEGAALDAAPYVQRFEEAMDDDFNTPQALAVLFDLARDLNRSAEQGQDVRLARQALRNLCGILGLTLEEEERDALALGPFIDLLVETRRELRAAKQFALADKVRNRLAELGIVLEDTPQGTKWSMKETVG